MKELPITRATPPLLAFRSRRAAVAGLTGALLGTAGVHGTPHVASRKRKKQITLCLNGQTVRVSAKRKRAYLADGAAMGACTDPPGLPPASSCVSDEDCPNGRCIEQRCLANLSGSIGGNWAHIVGGGGSILLYDRQSGAGICGTLDGRGFIPVEHYQDFAKNYAMAVGTARGSVLLLRKLPIYQQGALGATGMLRDGRWIFSNAYTDFGSWTHAVAAGDSVMLYNADDGIAATGTLIDGQWSYLNLYSTIGKDFTHLVGTDDSVLLYAFATRRAQAGTLINGIWTPTTSYEDIGNGPQVIEYQPSVGAGSSLLMITWSGLTGVTGQLANGAWQQQQSYPGFNFWKTIAHAGNGFLLFYDDFHELLAWGTLRDGVWEYYGTT